MNVQAVLPATLEAVSTFTQQLETHLADLPTETSTAIALAVHELLVNIVVHAYTQEKGDIDFQLSGTQELIAITIIDYAPGGFVMPASINEPDPLDLPEHGMGLFIIHQTFDEVTYERLSDTNRWHLKKMLGASRG